MNKREMKLIDRMRREVHCGGGPLTPESKIVELTDLKDLVLRAEAAYGNRTCIVEKVKKGKEKQVVSHTVKEFALKRAALGQALLDLGLKGRHIAIVGESSFNWILSFFAIVCGVGVAVPIDKELKDEEIARLCAKADCEAVFCTRAYLGAAKIFAENEPACKLVVCMNRGTGDGYTGV